MRINKFKNLILLLLITIVFGITNIEQSISKKKITLGDRFLYSIKFKSNHTPNVQFIAPGEVLVSSYNLFYEKKNRHQYQYIMHLSAFDLGSMYTPTVSISASKDKKILTHKFQVESIFGETETRNYVTTFKPQIGIKLKWWNYLYLFLVILCISTGIVYLYNRFKGNRTTKKINLIKQKSAFEVAQELLDKLSKTNLWETNVKEFYFQLSYIIKLYLSDKFKLAILESTTSEIKQEIKKINLHSSYKKDVISFFKSLDPIKYAQQTPSINEAKGMINQAKTIISEIENLKENKDNDLA